MEKQAIYKRIREIAYASDKDGGVCLRADLAYELKAFGLGNDSVELNTLVWEAYRYFQEDKVIRSVFMDNRNLDSLADLGQIWDMVDRLDADVLSPLLYSRLERGEKSLEGLNVLLSNIADYSSKSTGVDVMNSIVGTKGVAAVQGKASDMFSRYSAMIGGYQDARVVVSSLISDFTTLRSQVCDIYRRYSAMLVDVFGDSIKAVDPQLFDFDQIEWLDTRGMIQNVKLEYDKVLEKCKVLAGSISDSFRLSLNQSVGAYRTAGSKTAGLAIAGLNMFLHYAEAAQQTAELEQDLLKLKNIVKHDVVVVKGDLSRLTVIYKTMNDVFVPKADVFFRYAGQVLTVEWQQLEDELYGKSGVQELKHERDYVLGDMKYLEMEMADETSMIDFYTQRIEENRAVLESVTPQYDRAMAAKPSRPSGLGNVLSLGSSGKKYNREIYEWNQNCRPVIDRYKEVQIDIKLDTDELRQHKDSFEKNRIEYRKLKSRLSGINAAILKAVSVDRSVQMSLLPHVESMIRLLRLARQIAESRLDKKLTSKVSVGDISMDLPEDVSKNISTFIDAFNEGITAYTACSNDQEEEIVTRAENDAVQGVMNLVKECMKLNLMERQSVVVGEEYDRALGDLQASFKKYLPVLDMQADGLLEILRKINTAENHDDLMKGLLSLAGDDSSVFQGSDWTEFLKGNKTIEL